MPRYWHDRHAVNKMQDGVEKDLCRAIVADKKPYFMIYIYPKLMKQYKNYIKNTDRSALVEFQKTVSELQSKPYDELSDREKEFLRYYNMSLPVGVGSCVMNKICRRFEDEFDKYISRHNASHPFDYTFMKSGVDYGKHQYNEIKKLYCEYNEDLKDFSIKTNIDRINGKGQVSSPDVLYYEFRKRCDKICQNEIELCDIILDICYRRNATKTFAWNMCAKTIIYNLLSKNNNKISYPTTSNSGDIEFAGQKFTMQEKYIGDTNEYNFE